MFLKLRPYVFSTAGYTLLELIIAATLGVGVISISATAIFFNRNLLLRDGARVEVNQSLRTSLDIIGADIRQGGENLILSDFPVIELLDNARNGQDILVIRTGTPLDILTICADASGTDLLVADTSVGGVADCPSTLRSLDPADLLPDNLYNWQQYRLQQVANGEPAEAYIFDADTRDGEFFTFSDEIRNPSNPGNDPSTYSIRSSSGSWSGTYDAAGTRPIIAVITEQRYSVDDQGFLTEQVNGGVDSRLVSDIQDFQVRVLLQDGSELDAFGSNVGDDWSNIQAVEVTLSASSEFAAGREIDNTFTSSYLPRNVLSFPR
ncbi:MAG: type II secretion system protein J [Synechococcus sp.]